MALLAGLQPHFHDHAQLPYCLMKHPNSLVKQPQQKAQSKINRLYSFCGS
jgi:hypothetical protein